MIFKDREDAGLKLYFLIKDDPSIKKNKKSVLVLSLLRGGVVLGATLAKKLGVSHLPLVVTKIPAPYNPELAIGALCFEVTYLEERVINEIGLSKSDISDQIKLAEHKFIEYCNRFNIKEKQYVKLKNKIVVITDDGVATGATIKAAVLYVKLKKPKKIILAVPVAPEGFKIKGVLKQYFLHKDPYLVSVSQFYQDFPQVEDAEVKAILS